MKAKVNEVVSVLEEYFEDFLPNVTGVSENTIIAYQYSFQLLFGYLNEVKGIPSNNVTFAVLGDDTIADFLRYLEEERGCSVKTRNLRRAAIVKFAKYAAKKAFAISLPFHSEVLELPKKKEAKQLGVKYFTKEEIGLLLKLPASSKTIGQRDVTLLSLLYATGARAQEICDLTLGDITFSAPAKIRLTGKGNKSRVVTIPGTCVAILKEYLRSRNFDVLDKSTERRHLFSSQTNEHMSIACVEEIVKKYVAEAKNRYPQLYKETKYTPHSFRHSIAVHMLEAGDSLVAIKAFLGHESISTTAVYAQVTPELASKYLDERGKPLKNIQLPHKPQSLYEELPFLYKRRK